MVQCAQIKQYMSAAHMQQKNPNECSDFSAIIVYCQKALVCVY